MAAGGGSGLRPITTKDPEMSGTENDITPICEAVRGIT